MTHIPYDTAAILSYEYGFSVFPLRPRSKEAAIPWKQFQTQKASEEQLDKWAETMEYNWAVVCGSISDLVVFDCDNDDAVAWAKDHLPHTPMVVKTGKGWHLYYRFPHGREAWLNRLNPRKQLGIEADVQRDGKYVVAPGSIHPSGAVYTLKEFVDWSIVPEFTIFENGQSETPVDVDLAGVRTTATDIPQGGRNNALASFAGSLAHKRPRLSDQDILRQAWDWNVEFCKPPLPQAEFERTVRSIIEKDKREHPDTVGSVTQDQATSMDGVQLLDTEELDLPIPDVLLNPPPGLLRDIQQYTLRSSVRTTPMFATVGALSLISTLVGQKVQTESGLTTNMSLVCVGPSSSGKDAPKTVVSDLLDRVAPGYKGGNELASDAALINYLAEDGHQRCVFILDEVGMLLKACKNPNSPKAGLVKVLTELFSKTSSSYTKVYAKKENNKTIPWHALNILGLSVPNEFFGALQEGEAINGFLARLLVFIENKRNTVEKKFRLDRKIPDDLLRRLKELATFRVEETTITEDKNGTHALSFMPEPIVCPLSPEAEAYLMKKSREYDELQALYEEEGKAAAASIAGRAAEHSLKLSLDFLVCRKESVEALKQDHVISLQDMKYAWDVVEWCIIFLIRQIEYSIASSEFEAGKQLVAKIIMQDVRRSISKSRCATGGNAARPGSTLAHISKNTPGFSTEYLKKLLDKMIQANELRLIEGWTASEKSRRPLDLYCLVKDSGEDE